MISNDHGNAQIVIILGFETNFITFWGENASSSNQTWQLNTVLMGK
jgi:hypothetical protein